MKKQQEELSGITARFDRFTKNPPFVNDLWESVGTLAARLTDMQQAIDENLGTRVATKMRGFNNKMRNGGSSTSGSPMGDDQMTASQLQKGAQPGQGGNNSNLSSAEKPFIRG